jgi:hypothetical protein
VEIGGGYPLSSIRKLPERLGDQLGQLGTGQNIRYRSPPGSK